MSINLLLKSSVVSISRVTDFDSIPWGPTVARTTAVNRISHLRSIAADAASDAVVAGQGKVSWVHSSS